MSIEPPYITWGHRSWKEAIAITNRLPSRRRGWCVHLWCLRYETFASESKPAVKQRMFLWAGDLVNPTAPLVGNVLVVTRNVTCVVIGFHLFGE